MGHCTLGEGGQVLCPISALCKITMTSLTVGGTHVYLWLIHVVVWQKPSQYYNFSPNKINYFLISIFKLFIQLALDFPGGSDSKVSAYDVGDPGSIPGSRRSSGEGNGNPLQYPCLENPMDRGDWQAMLRMHFTMLPLFSCFSFYFAGSLFKITYC